MDKYLIEPGLVDLQVGVYKQPEAIKPLDVIAFKRAAVAPDADVVLFHGVHQHGPGHSETQRSGIEVSHPSRRNVKSAALQGPQSLPLQLCTAVNQAGFDRA